MMFSIGNFPKFDFKLNLTNRHYNQYLIADLFSYQASLHDMQIEQRFPIGR